LILLILLILEIFARTSYLVLCAALLSAIAYFTYGCQWEYGFATFSKANQSSDYGFNESIILETSLKTLAPLPLLPALLSKNADFQKSKQFVDLGKQFVDLDKQFVDLGGDVENLSISSWVHSSFCFHALWLTHSAYFFPICPRLVAFFILAIQAFILLAKACLHWQSFWNPSLSSGLRFYSVLNGMVAWLCLLVLWVSGLYLASAAVAELAIEPIDCECLH
jgi:hypothetical protein